MEEWMPVSFIHMEMRFKIKLWLVASVSTSLSCSMTINTFNSIRCMENDGLYHNLCTLSFGLKHWNTNRLDNCITTGTEKWILNCFVPFDSPDHSLCRIFPTQYSHEHNFMSQKWDSMGYFRFHNIRKSPVLFSLLKQKITEKFITQFWQTFAFQKYHLDTITFWLYFLSRINISTSNAIKIAPHENNIYGEMVQWKREKWHTFCLFVPKMMNDDREEIKRSMWNRLSSLSRMN